MKRFDLSSLPRCGAKTRSGGPCQRNGNKSNGRCKLHGGNSTGPKTQEGKIKVATNPVKDSMFWLLTQTINPKLYNEGVIAYNQLVDIEGETESSGQLGLLFALVTKQLTADEHQALDTKACEQNAKVMALVEQHRIALEYFKYIAYQKKDAQAFMLIQSALDLYYRNTGAAHQLYHRYMNNPEPPFFGELSTKEQKKFHAESLQKDIRRANRKGEFEDSPQPRGISSRITGRKRSYQRKLKEPQPMR